jgi:23S rRNA G2069 N7-methylase RlmK/C1962 C5-methylase RlmI
MVTADLFQKVVFSASRDAGASVQWLGRLGPGPDHPVHLPVVQKITDKGPLHATIASAKKIP